MNARRTQRKPHLEAIRIYPTDINLGKSFSCCVLLNIYDVFTFVRLLTGSRFGFVQRRLAFSQFHDSYTCLALKLTSQAGCTLRIRRILNSSINLIDCCHCDVIKHDNFCAFCFRLRAGSSFLTDEEVLNSHAMYTHTHTVCSESQHSVMNICLC